MEGSSSKFRGCPSQFPRQGGPANLAHLVAHKVRLEHLDRQALFYVRQSTLVQVRDNTGSTARQYDLMQRALDLGWPREHIGVIGQDQGHSGASAAMGSGS